MGKLLKIIIQIVVTLVLFIVAVVVILPLVVDPNDFKPEIEAMLEKKTGRTFEIEGDLELSVFPWLGLSTGKMALGNVPDFGDQPFAVIESSDVKVKLIPLLSKKYEVSQIVLKGLVLNLAKNAQGVKNWQKFDASKHASTETAVQERKERKEHKEKQENKPEPGHAEQPLETLSDVETSSSVTGISSVTIGGIVIENAQINWDDRKNGKHVEIKNVHFKTSELEFDQPVDMALSFTVFNELVRRSHRIEINTDLTFNEQLDKFTVNNFELNESFMEGQGTELLLTTQLSADFALDMVSQVMTLSDLQFKRGDLTVSAQLKGNNLNHQPIFKGAVKFSGMNLRRLFSELGKSLPAMQDERALSSLSGHFNLNGTKDSVDFEQLVLRLDDSTISGSTHVKRFSQPAVSFDLSIDSIDMDQYRVAKSQQTPAVAIANTETEAVVPEKPVQQSNASPKRQPAPIQLTSATAKKVSTKEITEAADPPLFPVEQINQLNIDGQLAIGKLKIKNLTMQDVVIQMQARDGIMKIRQSIKNFYQGSSNGTFHIDVSNSRVKIAINETFTNVQLEPLLKDFKGKAKMTGTVNVSAVLTSHGNSKKAIKSSLSGQMKFLSKQGKIKGFNLRKIIAKGKKIISGKDLPAGLKNHTEYSEISGTAKISNGLIKNDDLIAKSESLRVKGKGTANLATDQLDYDVVAKLIKSEATATEPEKIKRKAAFNIAGSFEQPDITLDITSLITEDEKQKLLKKLDKKLNKLDKKLGKDVGDFLRQLLKKNH